MLPSLDPLELDNQLDNQQPGWISTNPATDQVTDLAAEEDDEFRLAPPEPVAKKRSTFVTNPSNLDAVPTDSQKSETVASPANPKGSSKGGTANLDLSDIDLEDFDLGDLPSSNPSGSGEPNKSSDKTPNTPKILPGKIPPSKISPSKISPSEAATSRTDFRYPCKVCGTSMYAEITEVGNNVRCPDCYTEFSIPSPPPGWNRRKNIGPTSIDEGAAMPLAPAEGRGVRTSGPTTNTAKVIMANAEASLDGDDERTRQETYDFDTTSWAIRNFGFLRDPSAVIIALITGVFLGGALIAGLVIGGMVADRAADSEAAESTRVIANNFAIMLLALPIFLGALANGIAILEASANQLKRIARWPAFNIGEALGEVMVVAAAFALAALPGGLIQWFGTMIGLPNEIATILWLLITWVTFPIFLLSMLDNQSVSEPISLDVVKSMQSKFEPWGAMYLMTALSFIGLFSLYLLQTNDRYPIRFVMGFVIPMVIFFIFHQYGLLGARISSVTDLGFESLDEDDDVEETDDV